MMKYPRALLLSSVLLLTACNFFAPSTQEPMEDEESSSSSSVMEETDNVMYQGVLEPAGISIYMEGTHKLTLDDGRFILLQGDGVDLNEYLDEEVEVHGAIRPTVEGGGIIMRVESVVRVGESSSSSSSDSSSSSSMSAESSSAAAVVPPASSSPAPVSSSPSAQTSSEGGDERAIRAAAMAKADLSTANWTQQYCTGHMGFCMPVHKNWWFTSFGTTTSNLWHVEINNQVIEKIGDGPIRVQIVSGALSSNDGQVVANGDDVVGYKSWTENRHFEIHAPASLRGAVEYLISHITAYTPTEE